MSLNDFILPELLILVPVLVIIGKVLKQSRMDNRYIPVVLGILGVLLASIWVFATKPVHNYQEALIALFTALTQGLLVAGASVYCHQLIKQAGKPLETAQADNADGTSSASRSGNASNTGNPEVGVVTTGVSGVQGYHAPKTPATKATAVHMDTAKRTLML